MNTLHYFILHLSHHFQHKHTRTHAHMHARTHARNPLDITARAHWDGQGGVGCKLTPLVNDIPPNSKHCCCSLRHTGVVGAQMAVCLQQTTQILRRLLALRPQKPWGLLGTGSPGRPPRLSHSSWALLLRLYQAFPLEFSTLFTPSRIKLKIVVDASHVYVGAWALGCFHSHINLSEGADRVGGQLRGDE